MKRVHDDTNTSCSIYEASSATRLRIGLFYRDLASLQTFEQVTRKSVSLTKKGRRCGGVAPRLVRDSCRAGLEPRAVAENECTVARPRPPPIPYSIGFEGLETPLYTHTRIRKRQRNADGTSRPPPHGSRTDKRPQSRQSTRPDAWQAAHTHTQLSNNHSSKTCLARAHMHTLRQVRFLAQRIAAPVPVGAELARLQYFERHLYAFLFVRKLSPYGDEL